MKARAATKVRRSRRRARRSELRRVRRSTAKRRARRALEGKPRKPRGERRVRPPVLRVWTGDPINVDLFAGGGGASDGMRRALGRSPDIAVNHWGAALAMHEANHPDCKHYKENVYKVDPRKVTHGRPVRMLWASPTCSHFSRASGCKLKDRKIRGLAWSIIPWIHHVQPELIILENVVEFLGWGPLHDDHRKGCKGDENRKGCDKRCLYGKPIKEREGEDYAKWEAKIRSYGYSFEHRVIPAWQFGAPTTRERVYIQMRRDGQPATWPEPTHTAEESFAEAKKIAAQANAKALKAWRTAADIIDWSIPCPSIFERKKPHVKATRRRLAKGVRKYVLEAAKPFLLHLTHGDRHAPHSIDKPVPTVTCANRGEQALAVPFMIHRGNGERPGQDPRTYNIQKPHPVVVAGGIKTNVVATKLAFLAKAYGERRPTEVQAQDLDRPVGVVTTQDHHQLVAASTIKFYGTSTGSSLEQPLHTIPAGGEHHGIVAATLMRYNGQSIGQSCDAPIGTLDCNDRYAVVNAQTAPAEEWNDIIAAKARRVYKFLKKEGVEGPWMDHKEQLVRIPGSELVIYDLGMRMLVARELFRAQGFDDSYVIDLMGPEGKPLTKTEQVRMAGNSVCPDVAEALVRAAMSTLPTATVTPTRGQQLSMLRAA